MIEFRLLVLRCHNIHASKAFYENLGLSFVPEKHGSGVEHYSARVGGVIFELYPLAQGETPCRSRLGFRLDHLETIITTLPIHSQYIWHDQVVYVVVDPDGRKIELS